MGIFLIFLGVVICALASPIIKLAGLVLIGLGAFILFNPNIYKDAGVDTNEDYDDEGDV